MCNKLEIKKIYIDTRFKTGGSKSDTDFSIELPRQFNVPEGTVAYIDDVVIPVSWYSVTDSNRWLYFNLFANGTNTSWYSALEPGTYTGATLASTLQTQLSASSSSQPVTFTVTYSHIQNTLNISFKDDRVGATDVMRFTIYDDASLKNGEWMDSAVPKPNSANHIIGLTSTKNVFEGLPYTGSVDLHHMRNLYLCSSALASYDTVSNFGMDTIIKKIPARAGYNEIIFDNASEGFDYLNVSSRSLRTIDFKLVDSYFQPLDLQGMHWSFSIVFQSKN